MVRQLLRVLHNRQLRSTQSLRSSVLSSVVRLSCRPTSSRSQPSLCPRRDDNLISPCYSTIVCPQRARRVRTLQSVCALSLAAHRPPSAARSRLRRIGPSICLACLAWIPQHDHRCMCSCCCSLRWLRPPAGPAGCYPPKALPSESCVSSCLRATDEREASTPTALPRGHALGQKTWFRVTRAVVCFRSTCEDGG